MLGTRRGGGNCLILMQKVYLYGSHCREKIAILYNIFRRVNILGEKMEETIVGSYDASASFYDKRDWQLFWERNEKPIILKLFEFDKYRQILDIGCGTGTYILELLNRDLIIYGLDFSTKMLDICRQKINNKKDCIIGKIKLFDIPFLDNKFENESFDLILMTRVLCHFNNLDASLNEVHRLLKNQGDLIISDFHPDYKIKNAVLKNPKDGKKFILPISKFDPELLIKKLSNYNFQSKSLINMSMSKCYWIPDKGTSFDDELIYPQRNIFYIIKFTKGDFSG